jgi:glycosyltransferase involved in cell wall biosynthesis
MKLAINGSFLDQRITGQQRYAHEITSAITKLAASHSIRVEILGIGASTSRTTQWLKALLLGFKAQKDTWLITLTSRGPVFRSRHVVVIHDLFVLTNKDWFSKKYWLFHSFILKAQLKSADLVVCVSNPIAEQLKRSHLTKARIIVAPNAPAECFVQRNWSNQDRINLLNKLGLHDNGFFLAVGAADPRKNVSLLIDAHKALKDEVRDANPLVLVGRQSNLFAKTSLQIDERIVWLSDVTDTELAILYSSCLTFVMPSLAEGFGLPVVEALASGANVVLNDLEVFHWVAGNHATYVDCSKNENSLSSKLQEITQSKNTSVKRKYSNEFSWDKSAKIILDAIVEEESRILN